MRAQGEGRLGRDPPVRVTERRTELRERLTLGGDRAEALRGEDPRPRVRRGKRNLESAPPRRALAASEGEEGAPDGLDVLLRSAPRGAGERGVDLGRVLRVGLPTARADGGLVARRGRAPCEHPEHETSRVGIVDAARRLDDAGAHVRIRVPARRGEGLRGGRIAAHPDRERRRAAHPGRGILEGLRKRARDGRSVLGEGEPAERGGREDADRLRALGEVGLEESVSVAPPFLEARDHLARILPGAGTRSVQGLGSRTDAPAAGCDEGEKDERAQTGNGRVHAVPIL